MNSLTKKVFDYLKQNGLDPVFEQTNDPEIEDDQIQIPGTKFHIQVGSLETYVELHQEIEGDTKRDTIFQGYGPTKGFARIKSDIDTWLLGNKLKANDMKNSTEAVKSAKTKKADQTSTVSKTKSLTEVNKAKATQKAKDEEESHHGRESKYQYPEDCTSAEDKKAFRRKARQQKSSLESKIAKLQESNEAADQKELKKLTKEYHQFENLTYQHPEHN